MSTTSASTVPSITKSELQRQLAELQTKLNEYKELAQNATTTITFVELASEEYKKQIKDLETSVPQLKNRDETITQLSELLNKKMTELENTVEKLGKGFTAFKQTATISTDLDDEDVTALQEKVDRIDLASTALQALNQKKIVDNGIRKACLASQEDA